MERGAVIVAGFGFRGTAQAASLRDALARVSAGRGVAALATVADKADALRGLAAELGVAVIALSAADLAGVVTVTQSGPARAARGVGSMAEAAALAGAGRGATLLGARVVSADRMATCALAEGNGR